MMAQKNKISSLNKSHLEKIVEKYIEDRKAVFNDSEKKVINFYSNKIDLGFKEIGGWTETRVVNFCKVYSSNFQSTPSIFTYKKYSGKKMEQKLLQYKKDCIVLDRSEKLKLETECPHF